MFFQYLRICVAFYLINRTPATLNSPNNVGDVTEYVDALIKFGLGCVQSFFIKRRQCHTFFQLLREWCLQARSQVSRFGGAKHILGGKAFCFHCMFKTNFSGNNKIRRAQKKFPGALPRMLPRGYGPALMWNFHTVAAFQHRLRFDEVWLWWYFLKARCLTNI